MFEGSFADAVADGHPGPVDSAQKLHEPFRALQALPALGVQDVVIEQAPAGLCLGGTCPKCFYGLREKVDKASWQLPMEVDRI